MTDADSTTGLIYIQLSGFMVTTNASTLGSPFLPIRKKEAIFGTAYTLQPSLSAVLSVSIIGKNEIENGMTEKESTSVDVIQAEASGDTGNFTEISVRATLGLYVQYVRSHVTLYQVIDGVLQTVSTNHVIV